MHEGNNMGIMTTLKKTYPRKGHAAGVAAPKGCLNFLSAPRLAWGHGVFPHTTPEGRLVNLYRRTV